MNASERIADDPVTSGLWEHLVELVDQVGACDRIVGAATISCKRCGGRVFLVVRPRIAGLTLEIDLPVRLISTRSRKQIQTAGGRWRNHVVIFTGGELDDELCGWIEEAYAASGQPD